MGDSTDDSNGTTDGIGTGESPVWLTVPQAARKLGVTPSAIRNRVKRGTLEKRPNGNRGFLVLLPTGAGNGVDTPEDEVTETVSMLRVRVESLEAERDWLRAQVERLSESRNGEPIQGIIPRFRHWLMGNG